MTRRKFAVSDIHGHGHVLEKLLAMANYHPLHDDLFLLGDYIHKGPDSEATLNLVKALVNNGAIGLQGNHERKLLFGCAPQYQDDVPSRLLEFVRGLPLWFEDEEFIYAHAGIRPGVPLVNQSSIDLLTIREPFHNTAHHFGKTVVFGHTPTYRLGAARGEVWWQADKIGIDTGAAERIALTLVDLTNRIHFSQPLS